MASTHRLPLDSIRALVQRQILDASGGTLIAVYLFGSLAEGRARPESDVDLGLLSTGDIDPYDLFVCAQDLGRLLGKDVDLVDLSRASTVMRAHVVGEGRRVLVEDRFRADEFEMYALSDYARLNQERQIVIESFKGNYRDR